MRKVLNIFRGFFAAVHDINEKYKRPQIKMTHMVSFSLIMLRLYLFFMIAILLFKFITLALKGGSGVVP
ncbi:MAG: hypothetical protein M1591_06260 [Deltaproteobacteria bacterium]|nr:hypothetical protein [Deltaproteobacteria bacterium]MCL5878378.1 hypothetical protein [Deltaproteobacteria bacterium]